MNLAPLELRAAAPSKRALMERALEPHVLLGMPHLTPHGLSETWVMKELGHRHWLLLGRHLGLDDADFRTADGRQAYAAICATSLRGARFDEVGADDVLAIHSLLVPVSRSQVSTQHRLAVGDMVVGEVELISTFVHRARAGDNHSVARVAVPQGPAPPPFQGSALAGQACELRAGRLAALMGFSLAATRPRRRCRLKTSPSQDFNGAGLFYFAQFQALADRAFEHWFGAGFAGSRERQVFFLGNIEASETVCVELMGQAGNRTHCRLRRDDGKTIAHLCTVSAGGRWSGKVSDA